MFTLIHTFMMNIIRGAILLALTGGLGAAILKHYKGAAVSLNKGIISLQKVNRSLIGASH